jgi:diacylglycerol kinase family enzyme
MRYCFIINPNSRSQRGRAIWEEVQKELEKSQIKYEIYLTERRKNATAIAAMLTADQEEKTLVVLGGDGTVNEVLNGIQNFDHVILGYIPTGSSNDFARGMKIPKDPVKALYLVLHPQAIQKMDIGVVDYGEKSRRFAVSAGIDHLSSGKCFKVEGGAE